MAKKQKGVSGVLGYTLRDPLKASHKAPPYNTFIISQFPHPKTLWGTLNIKTIALCQLRQLVPTSSQFSMPCPFG